MPWPKGRRQTIEHRQKNSISHRDPRPNRQGIKQTEEHKRKVREALTGQKRSPETCQKLSEIAQTREYSAERRENMSRAARKLWEEGKRDLPRNMYKKSGGVHNGVWMRCLNSEGVFARQLDEAGIKWVYEPKRFKTSLGTYLPDFFLPEFNIYVDVKGTRPRPSSFAKMEAFRREHGKCLIVVYQRELESFRYKREV